uniref:Terminase n=1 Tax=viral metagenome TaxID=1070528 RepID=A0A6M3Y8P8_9ZZZZ
MPNPTHCHYDRNDRSTMLYFADGTFFKAWIKGGVCFPTRYKTKSGGIDNMGFIVLGVQDIEKGTIKIYEQMPWITVNNILSAPDDPSLPTNAMKYPGLALWLRMVWSKYFAEKFYYHQPEYLSDVFKEAINRNDMIKPKPQMIELEISRETQYLDSVWHAVKSDRLIIDEETELGKDLKAQMKDDQYMPPSIQALGCCLMAFERFIYRKQRERPLQEVWFA